MRRTSTLHRLMSLTVLVVSLAGCSAARQQVVAPTPFATATKALSEGRLDDAEQAAHAALEGGHPRAAHLLTEVLLRRGRHHAAIAVIKPVSDAAPTDQRAALLLAQALDGAGKTKAAIAAYVRRLKLVPSDKPSGSRLADLLLSEGNAMFASKVAKALVKQHPNDAIVLTLLSRALLARGMLAAALEAASDATKQAPKDAMAWMQLAKSQLALGEHRLAVEAYRRSLGVDPQLSDALLGLGGLLLQRRDYRAAKIVLKRGTKVSPDDPRGWNALAAAHNRLAEHDEAVMAMRAAHALSPRHPLLLRNLVEVLLDAGRADEAMGLAQTIIDSIGNDGISETARLGLRRSLVRAVVVAAMANQLCRGKPNAAAVSQRIVVALKSHGLAATKAQVTRFAQETTPQSAAAIRRCRRSTKLGKGTR